MDQVLVAIFETGNIALALCVCAIIVLWKRYVKVEDESRANAQRFQQTLNESTKSLNNAIDMFKARND